MVRRRFPSQRRRLAYTYQGGRTLLSLPPEIRNRIWQYVVTQDEAVAVSSAINEHLRFVRTCRQMYAEAYLMYFDRNRFLFYLDETSASQEAHFTFLLKLRSKTRLILLHNTVWWLLRSPGIPQTAPPVDHNFSLEMFFQQIYSLEIGFSPGWLVQWRYKPSEYTDSFIQRLVEVHGREGFYAAHNPAKRWIFENLARHIEAKSLCSRRFRAPWSFLVEPNRRNTWRLVGIIVIDIAFEAHQNTLRRMLQMVGDVSLLPLMSDTPNFIWHHPLRFFLVAYPAAKIESILQHLAIRMVVRLRRRIGARAVNVILDVCHIFWRTLPKLKDIRSISLLIIKGGRKAGPRRKRESRHGLKNSVLLLITFWPLLVCTFVCFAAICSQGDGFTRTLCTVAVKTDKLRAVFATIAVGCQKAIALLESIAIEVILRAIKHKEKEALWGMVG